MKILGIIFGILMVIGGGYCIASPGVTFMSLLIVLAITMIEWAIANLILWIKVKKAGGKNGRLIVNAIVSAIAGIGLLTNAFAQFFTADFMLIMIALIVLAGGVELIIKAFNLKKLPRLKKFWIPALILGILMTISGVMSLINPVALALTLGVMTGIDIMMAGFGIIVISLVSD